MADAPFLLERLGTLLHQSVRDAAARHRLQPIHIQVLQYLGRANHYSDLPIAVAEYFGITRGTVSQSLAVLERRGLVAKQPDARHGRRIHFRLTEAGAGMLRDSWARQLDEALRSRPGADAIEEALRDVLVALQRANGRRAFGICHECAHFRHGPGGTHCGLTGEPLAIEQTTKICREWAAPATARAVPSGAR